MAKIFQHADIVVGMHGAGLANAVLVRPIVAFSLSLVSLLQR